MPLKEADLAKYVGAYVVGPEGEDERPGKLSMFAKGGSLMGSLHGNDPTRFLYQGGDEFRPKAAPVFLVTFRMEGERAGGVSIASPEGVMEGERSDASGGALFDELARMDEVLFEAAFVSCDRRKWDSMMTEDVEFYHDRGGFSEGAAVSPPAECPAEHGVTRHVVQGSVEVFPIADYGAVQRGTHCFVEEGAATSTVAQFVHVWARTGDGWKVKRILSFDHRVDGEGVCAGE